MPKIIVRYLMRALVLLIFVGAIYLLHNKLKAYSIDQIYHSYHQIPLLHILASIGLMIINYIILIGYDWLAIKAINKKLSFSRIALVSYVGQAFSYNFGALLGGTTVRYRMYSTWDFDITDIVRLVLMLAVTFWVGALGLCGLVFIVYPPELPEFLLDKLPFGNIQLLGALLLSVTIIYLIACFFIRKPLTICKKEFFFPSLRIAVLQTLVAGIDLIVAAACMYVLLPEDLNLAFIHFLPNFLMAQVAVVLTHVPGGIGVFELIILHLTESNQESAVIAAVFSFRVIYYILPLLGAAFALTAYEMRIHKDLLHSSNHWLSVFSNSIAALATFMGGAILIFISTLPTLEHDHSIYIQHNSVILANISSFITLLAGTMLLFLAYGLERRQIIAWRLAILALICGLVSSLINGIHYIPLIIIALIILYTISAKRRCYRKSFILEEKIPLKWLFSIWTILSLSAILTYFTYKYTEHDVPFILIQGSKDYIHSIYPIFGVMALLLALYIYRYFKNKNK